MREGFGMLGRGSNYQDYHTINNYSGELYHGKRLQIWERSGMWSYLASCSKLWTRTKIHWNGWSIARYLFISQNQLPTINNMTILGDSLNTSNHSTATVMCSATFAPSGPFAMRTRLTLVSGGWSPREFRIQRDRLSLSVALRYLTSWRTPGEHRWLFLTAISQRLSATDSFEKVRLTLVWC